MQIIDGRKLRDEILTSLKEEVASLYFEPIFCDVLVGEDLASTQYVRMKKRTAESIGISFHDATFSSTISTNELVEEIKILNKMPNMCGIIVQLPLPAALDRRAVLDAIDPELDVDSLGTVASEKFYNNSVTAGFPTALACMKLLNSIDVDLKDKKIIVLGRGELVGRPVAALLKFQGFSPVIVSSQTENKETLIKQADVIISGIGKSKFITGNMIKKDAVLIDAGTSESEGGIVGDIDFDSVKDTAGFISPVPGGVGPVTVAMLFNNVLKVAKQK